MVADVNVFSAFVHLGTTNQANAGLIIRVKRCGQRGTKAYLGEEITEPDDLTGSYPHRDILSFGCTSRCDCLFLRVPHYRSSVEEDDVSAARFAIGGVGNKISVTISNGLIRVGGLRITDAEVGRVFEVSKNLPNGGTMSGFGILGELANATQCVGNVGASTCLSKIETANCFLKRKVDAFAVVGVHLPRQDEVGVCRNVDGYSIVEAVLRDLLLSVKFLI